MGFFGTILFADRSRENKISEDDDRKDSSLESAAAQSPGGRGGSNDDNRESEDFKGDTDRLLDCPCLDGMKDGPCGADFLTAFRCFILSTEPEKGADCVSKFTSLEVCLMANNEALTKAPKGKQKAPNIPEVPADAIRLPDKISEWANT
ncbi:hypothetical protein Mapa_000877 [Marchantia paleacea]|nr:hypothetical protein Mapa_000877 [Marchantia paleacea]